MSEIDDNETDTAIEPWPIDPALVVKGETIPREALNVRAQPGTDEYRFAMMAKASEIERHMHCMRMPVTICHRGNDLYVLTDTEAVEYHMQRSDKALAAMGRHSVAMRLVVDRSRLTDEKRLEHDRNMALSAMRYQAARGARIELRRREADPAQGQIPRTLGIE